MNEFAIIEIKTHLLDGNNFRVERFRTTNIFTAMQVLSENPQWHTITTVQGSDDKLQEQGFVEGTLQFWQHRVKRWLYAGHPTNYIAYRLAHDVQEGDAKALHGRVIEFRDDNLSKVFQFCDQPGYEKVRIWREFDDGIVLDLTPAEWEVKLIKDEGLLTPDEITAATGNELWILSNMARDDVDMKMFRRAVINYAHAVQRHLKKGQTS